MAPSLPNHSIPHIPILMYHSVSDVSERDKKIRSTNPAYSLSVNQFRQQMEYVHKNGHKTLHLNQLLSAASLINEKKVIPGKAGIQKDTVFRIKCGMTDSLKSVSLCIDDKAQVPEKSLVITFDDGWADNYTNVLPILKEYGLRATIFVITGFIGQSNYMDWQQLREMSEAGISIQSHTVSHRPLAQLSKTEVEYELETSKKTIADALGKQVYFLSLPHGVFNNKVLEIAKDAGYKAICTSEPGYSHTQHKNLLVLKRINISDSNHIEMFKKIVRKNQMVLLPLIISKKIKNLLRKIVGYDTYRSIYNLRYLIKN